MFQIVWRRMAGRQVTQEFKRASQKLCGPNYGYYLNIYLDDLGITRRTKRRDRRWRGQHSTQVPPVNKSQTLSFQLPCSVICECFGNILYI